MQSRDAISSDSHLKSYYQLFVMAYNGLRIVSIVCVRDSNTAKGLCSWRKLEHLRCSCTTPASNTRCIFGHTHRTLCFRGIIWITRPLLQSRRRGEHLFILTPTTMDWAHSRSATCFLKRSVSWLKLECDMLYIGKVMSTAAIPLNQSSTRIFLVNSIDLTLSKGHTNHVMHIQVDPSCPPPWVLTYCVHVILFGGRPAFTRCSYCIGTTPCPCGVMS